MMEICSGMRAGEGRRGLRIDHCEVIAEDYFIDIKRFPGGEQDLSMPRNTHRQNTIKHVDALGDAFLQLLDDPNSHEVARVIFGEQRTNSIQYAVHFLFHFSDRETADCVAVKPNGDQFLRTFFTQVAFEAALDDTK